MRSSFLSLLVLSTAIASSLAHQRSNFNIFEQISGEYLNSKHETSVNALRPRADNDQLAAATAHIQKIAPSTSYRLISDHYRDEDTGILHAYFVQTYNGIDIDNTQVNVNVKNDGTILSAGSSFVTGELKAPKVVKRQQLDPTEVLKGVFEKLKLPGDANNAQATKVDNLAGGPSESYVFNGVHGTLTEPTAQLKYFLTPEKELKLIYRLETDFGDNWLITFADALTKGTIHRVTDYVADAKYRVYPLGINDPTDGERELVVDPAREESPNGWHESGSNKYTTTRGNNGIAQENWDGGSDFLNNIRADGGTSLNFDFPYSVTTPNPKDYIFACTTQLFYTANIYHDLLESLGFTEQAGNFEEVNTGPGGLGGDAVLLNAQDGSGLNNANFATPPDGSRPRMRMYLWSGSPQRDGDFDLGIILHEYTHGLSNRLTGGPANSGCLSTLESGGMGEGWSDFFPTTIRIKPGDDNTKVYTMGDWANGSGIRPFPYATDMTINPTTYGTINGNSWQAVHAIGSVWANILYGVMWNLVDKHGYSDDIFPTFKDGTKIPTSGRSLALKLVLEGMKLQPCNPTFVSARDSIIDADLALTNGENFCELWRGFAKRGLGKSASRGTGNRRVEAFDLPEECK